MISLKDIIMMGTLAGMVIPGGIYVHDIKDNVIVLAQDFIGDQMLRNQKEIWIYQDRMKSDPGDKEAQDKLRTLEYEKKLLEYKREKFQGSK